MVIAKSPGTEEDECGRPMVGASGSEGRHQLDINGITALGVRIDNICKCNPPKNRELHADEVRTCTDAYLVPDILVRQPTHIIAMGAEATQFFLGDVSMEMVHGIPRTIDFYGLLIVLIPTYHPAHGMHSPSNMILFHADMRAAGDVIKGRIAPHPPEDAYPEPEYRLAKPKDIERMIARDPKVVAMDTEWARKNPWCLSISDTPGTSLVAMAEDKYTLFLIDTLVNRPDIITVIHNNMYDAPVLAQMGIFPRTTHDTMVIAYLLQNEPQGLKPLAFRHCGMTMNTYTETVGQAQYQMAMDYLELVLALEWPKPDPILEWRDGEPKMKMPQRIERKVRTMLGKNPPDPFDKWKAMDGKEMVEQRIGPMPEAELCDIPFDIALQYSARDADATLRVYPILWERICALGLQDTFERDMRAMPMVVDMQGNGMPVNPRKFHELSAYFQTQMDRLQAEIQKVARPYMGDAQINPGSPVKMAELIYDRLRLHEKGGRHKSKKAKSKLSTSDDILKRYVTLHPVVQNLIDWRGYQKLKGTYADAIPPLAAADGRVRCTLRMTRTATGRLCVDPETLVEAPRDMQKFPEGIRLKDLKIGDMVYSFDWRRELCIKRVKWVGPTQTKKTVIIHWEQKGKCNSITVSKEHLVRMFDGSWKHAGDIKVGERLLGMVARHNHGQGYFTFYPHSKNRKQGVLSGGKIKEHRFICEYLCGEKLHKKMIVHHKDENAFNNSPDNLELLSSTAEHVRLHSASIEELQGYIDSGIGRAGKPISSDTKRKYADRIKRLRIQGQARRALRGTNHTVFCVQEGPEMELWDLEIEDTHCFIGNEIALHNSSANPNLMAQPVRSDEGLKIRECYEAPEGRVLLSGDFSQIEMRTAAHMAQDERMLQIFRDGLDIHAQTASWMFGIPIDQLDPREHRYPAKRIGFGVLYMLTGEGLKREMAVAGLDWTLQKCEDAIHSWFDVFNGIAGFMKEVGHYAKRYGYVKDMYGRIRYIPGIRSLNKWQRMDAERQAGNAPIQMGATGIMKEAMARLVPFYKPYGPRLFPCLPIHDDIVWEVDETIVEEVVPKIRGIMEGAAPDGFSVPLKVDFKWGKSWGDQDKK